MSWTGSAYFLSHTLHAGLTGLSPRKCVTAKLDKTLLDSTVTIHSLLCLAQGDYGQLLVVKSTVLQPLAYSGPELRLAPRLWLSDSEAMTVGHRVLVLRGLFSANFWWFSKPHWHGESKLRRPFS